VISNVVNRTFTSYPHSQSEVGGWPTLNTFNVPTDTDRDGMPDYWETSLGLNPYVANNNHTNADGYTDLEHYLNWLADLHAACVQDSYVDVNLRNFTAGMANNATYTVLNPTNGTVALLGDGRTARFTPAAGFFGRGSFRFTSSDNLAGGGMTNTIQVLVTPVASPPRFTGITAGQGQMVVRGTGGLPYTKYYALIATNVSEPAINWSRLATNQFDASGNFLFTNVPASGVSRTFYRLQLLTTP
jgi:hypothetical protein